MPTPEDQIKFFEQEGYFRFNDLVFNIPPTDISISHRGAMHETSYLRSRHSSKTKTGRGVAAIDISMVVLPEELWKLHRLIQQFKYTPFWEIDNEYVRTAMLPSGSPLISMAVCAEHMVITSIEENPNAFSVKLALSWFNYAPFASLFSFKKNWNFKKADGKVVTIFDIERDTETDGVPEDYPRPQTDKPLEIIDRAQYLEYTDLTSPIVEHLPTNAVEADDSNIYVLYINWLQSVAMERDFGADNAINRATGRDDNNKYDADSYINAIPYDASQFGLSDMVRFTYKEYKRLSPSSDLAKLLDKNFTRLRQSADTYQPEGRNTAVIGTGTIRGPSGKQYQGVGTPLVTTDGIGRVSSNVGRRNSTKSGGSSNHKGTDIGWSGTDYANQGISIHSPIEGFVRYSTADTGSYSDSFGGWLIIEGTGDHQGLFVRQGHMSNNGMLTTGRKVTVGDFVGNAGTQAQEIGHGSIETHPVHHHVELWENGAPLGKGSNVGGTPRLMDLANVQTTLSQEVGALNLASKQVDVGSIQENKKEKYELPSQDELDAALIEVKQEEANGWHLYNSPHVSPTLYRVQEILVPATGLNRDGLVAAVWGVELVNRFAHLPILSHEFPTAQYMGGQEARLFFQFLDLNTGKEHDGLSYEAQQIFQMKNTLEYNSRLHRTIPESWFAEVEFIGANLAGSDTWVVSSIGTNSIPGSPGLYQLQLEMDASAPFEIPKLDGVTYDTDQLYRVFYEELREHYKVDGQETRREEGELVRNVDGVAVGQPFHNKTGQWYVKYDNLADKYDDFLRRTVDFITMQLTLVSYSLSDKYYGGYTPVEIPEQFDAWGFEQDLLPMFGNVNANPNTDLLSPSKKIALQYTSWQAWLDVFNLSDFAQNDTNKGQYNQQLATTWDTYKLLVRNKLLGIEFPGGAYERRVASGFEASEEFRAERQRVLDDAREYIVDGARATSAKEVFNFSPQERLYIKYAHTSPDLERAVFEDWKEILAAILRETVAEVVDRDHKAFPRTIELARKSAYANISAAYPDLLLPDHPIMQNQVMTFPDFYFFNESEDGDVDDLSDTQWKEQLETSVKNSWGSLRDFASGKKFKEEFNVTGEPPQNTAMSGSNFGNNSYTSKKNKLEQSLQDYLNAESDFVDPKTGRLPSRESGIFGGNRNVDHTYGEEAIKQLAIESANELIGEKFFLMRKAFPTFKLEFVDDNGRDGWRSLSDFYGYSALKRITLTRSRKIPADLAIIELQNVGGVLDGSLPSGLRDIDYIGRETQDGALTGRAKEADRRKSNKNDEQLFDAIVLREGMDIRLRLGYANNPEYMENVFNGRVLQVSWDDNNDHVSIMCQAYTTELVAVEKGVSGEKFKGNTVMDNPTLSRTTGYVDTAELLNSMLQSPEVLHFGRFEFGSIYQPGEAQQADFEFNQAGEKRIKRRTTIHSNPNWWGHAEDAFYSVVGQTFGNFIDILPFIDTTKFDPLSAINDVGRWLPFVGPTEFKYKFREVFNNPVDDNVFAPSVDDMVDWGLKKPEGGFDTTGNISKNEILYYPVNTTIWDVFQEMTLRHPGWIASPVPYGRRMTMFFGVPSQRYWSKPVPKSYKLRMKQLREKIEKLRPAAVISRRRGIINPNIDELAGLVTEYVAGLASRFRPFRRYHLASSRHNLVGNNIAVSSYGVWNSVSVTYTKAGKANKNGEKKHKVKTKGKLIGGNWWKTLELKAHSQIPDEDVLAESIDYFNCNGDALAKRYAVGSIMKGLKDMYKGSITLVGNARIKPYDIIMLADDYNGIAGPVEVEEVTHIFTPESGFISVITPDAVVIANEASSFPVMVGLAGGVVLNLLNKRMKASTLMAGYSVLNAVAPTAVTVTTAKLIYDAAVAKSQNSGRFVESMKVGASVFEPKVADTFLNIQNYWYWTGQSVAVNVVPLMKDGKPWIAGLPDDLFETQWENFKGVAKSAIQNGGRGRLATIISSQIHGYQVSIAYNGDMTLNQKWRADKLTSQ